MLKHLARRLAILAMLAISAMTGSPERAAAADPDKLNIAVILSAGIESAWDGTLIEALERAKVAKPHGLDITWKYTDPLWGDDAGDAMRLFAESGEYDVIWAHSTYSDQVKKLREEFPDILFVVVGSGNEGLGGNQYWVYKRVHEPAYLLGYAAGKLTKSNRLGAVGTFPADDVNDEINAFFAGAKAANPAVERTVAFIESWYDPAKAGEYTKAQIATGADLIFQLTGNFKPCEEAKILCFGNFQDQKLFSPSTVLSSAVAQWDPDVSWIVDEWWAHKAEGKSYQGNTDKRWFAMKDGGSAVVPNADLQANVPAAVQTDLDALKARIMAGSFEVPVDVSDPKAK
ncbi:BMP family protein [Aminobacter sp. MDW-2]|uniref:BMP family lipoprotein n=1 Tax=Aminobacter sp. MDW-2 TaxID=2666139 RepID=UPI0012AF6808|nr:BMP family protein [Aminobacter sp. MDW-2]MRX34325.1 BMP family ABC transporter substrate-binding protein [Aminobacter sp. MDW-2]QNH33043.1 BMP family protein [Aminobacter sp. MDW-2]